MMVLRDRGRRETEIETEKVIERKKRNLIELKKIITIDILFSGLRNILNVASRME